MCQDKVLKGGGVSKVRNPEDSGREDWGTLGKMRGITNPPLRQTRGGKKSALHPFSFYMFSNPTNAKVQFFTEKMQISIISHPPPPQQKNKTVEDVIFSRQKKTQKNSTPNPQTKPPYYCGINEIIDLKPPPPLGSFHPSHHKPTAPPALPSHQDHHKSTRSPATKRSEIGDFGVKKEGSSLLGL